MYGLDGKDEEILELLRTDASMPKKKIARRLALPLTTVHNRIMKMRKEGVITGYTVLCDWKKLGYGITAFISVSVDYGVKDFSQGDAARRIRALPGVEYAAIVTGTTDIMVKVREKDTDALNRFLLERLRKVPGIDKTTTLVVLKEFE